jgi:inhibitor of cysteine peptidase
MKIHGTVVFQDIEGGFWGIEGDDGRQYRPVEDLPASVRSSGTRIEAEMEPVEMASFTMWGRNVRIRSIKAV